MTRFKVRIRCLSCGNRWEPVIRAADEDELAAIPDPPCPACKKASKRKAFDFKSGKAPAAGGSIMVRAIDQTAEIVMTDHKMTDLRSDVRAGESMAPKLAPRLQAMADNMFARPNRQRPQAGIFGLPPRAVMQAAVSGRFNTPDTVNPVAVQHRKKDRAPVHIIAGDGVRSGRQ